MIRIRSNFILNFTNVCLIVNFFLAKLLTLDVLFSTAVRAVVVPKLVRLSILILISFILALLAAVVAKLIILGVLRS